jgi:transketolase
MISAGLASTDKMIFAVIYSVFTSMRALEQLRTFIFYPKLNVKIIGGLCGFSAGIEGVTHMALEDAGIIRCIPNIVIFNPADYYSTKKAVYEIAKTNMPCY